MFIYLFYSALVFQFYIARKIEKLKHYNSNKI